MKKIIIAFIVIIVQTSCSPSSKKEYNFAKNYDNLSIIFKLEGSGKYGDGFFETV